MGREVDEGQVVKCVERKGGGQGIGGLDRRRNHDESLLCFGGCQSDGG